MRFGDDLIQVVRDNSTAAQTDKGRHRYADLRKGDEKEFTQFIFNGDKVPWDKLGDATGTRGKDVKGNGGISTGDSYMQQMKTDHESSITYLPVCAGDGGDNLVEVSAPFIDSVYEHSVTIRSSNPGKSGICSASADRKTWKDPKYGEGFRVHAKKNLFSSRQMRDLCSMCGLDMHHGVCGAPGHNVEPEDVCKATNADINAVKASCGKEFKEGTDWYNVCVMEACASGEGSVAIAKIEQHVQHRMDKEDADDAALIEA